MRYVVIRRKFTALKYPKGSVKRKTLNKDNITSEYMPSYKYALHGYDGKRKVYSTSFRTKTEAEKFSMELGNPKKSKRKKWY